MRLVVCGLCSATVCVCWLMGWAGQARWSAATARAAMADETTDQSTDPMSANGACYVCHMTFVRESLAKSHLKAKVGCVKCHGASAKHANDENIGATKPDITFQRSGVDAMCIACHAGHNATASKVIARFQERNLSAKEPPTCTNCHGEHKIMRPEEKDSR